MTKGNSGRKGFDWLIGYNSSPWEAWAGAQGRNLRQRWWRNTAYWLVSAAFPIQTMPTCLGVMLPTVDWTPTSGSNQEVPSPQICDNQGCHHNHLALLSWAFRCMLGIGRTEWPFRGWWRKEMDSKQASSLSLWSSHRCSSISHRVNIYFNASFLPRWSPYLKQTPQSPCF